MEKQITIEKQKKLKNETMFNFKNVSLMKKQLFSLMMAFALVVGLSVSAWAQVGQGTIASPEFQFAGAQKTFSVTANGSNSFDWDVLQGVTSVLTNTDHVQAGYSGNNSESFTMTWAAAAAGSYIVQVTESTSNTCATVRQYHVTIIDLDVDVYACTSDGTRINVGADELADCGINSSYNPFDNDNVNSGNSINDPDNNGSLTDVVGTDPLNLRYVAVELSSTNVTLSDLDFDWQFDFLVEGTGASEFVSAATSTTGATVSGQEVTVLAQTNEMVTKAVLDCSFNVRWGIDIPFTIRIAESNLRLSIGGADAYTAGNEAADKYNAVAEDAGTPKSNISAQQTFYGSPATSVITAN